MHIAGTLTAGDAAGAGNTFYAGRIRKNLLPYSDSSVYQRDSVLVNDSAALIETGSAYGRTMHGYKVQLRETTFTGPSWRWASDSMDLNRRVVFKAGRTYTMSIYVKSEDILSNAIFPVLTNDGT